MNSEVDRCERAPQVQAEAHNVFSGTQLTRVGYFGSGIQPGRYYFFCLSCYRSRVAYSAVVYISDLKPGCPSTGRERGLARNRQER